MSTKVVNNPQKSTKVHTLHVRIWWRLCLINIWLACNFPNLSKTLKRLLSRAQFSIIHYFWSFFWCMKLNNEFIIPFFSNNISQALGNVSSNITSHLTGNIYNNFLPPRLHLLLYHPMQLLLVTTLLLSISETFHSSVAKWSLHSLSHTSWSSHWVFIFQSCPCNYLF